MDANSAFDKLAFMVLAVAETPTEPARAWQSKVACQVDDATNEAFIEGFYEGVFKQASDTSLYILGSELGKELGISMLYNMKQAMK